MIIVIHHNAQNNQVQLMFEGGTPDAVYAVMSHMVGEMEKQQAAQNNGQARRPSGLIIPPTIVPRHPKTGDENA